MGTGVFLESLLILQDFYAVLEHTITFRLGLSEHETGTTALWKKRRNNLKFPKPVINADLPMSCRAMVNRTDSTGRDGALTLRTGILTR